MSKLNPQTPVMNEHTARARAHYEGVAASIKMRDAMPFGKQVEREALLKCYNEAYAAEFKSCQSQFRIAA